MQFIDLKKQYEALKTQIDSSIGKVLSEAHFIGGEEVSALASELATYTGAKHCLTCANGTDALTLALRCFDVKAGDAVSTAVSALSIWTPTNSTRQYPRS